MTASTALARQVKPYKIDFREDISMGHVYKVVELVGSSTISIEDAINTAVSRASDTLRNLRWFEVLHTRGHIEEGQTVHFQVTLRVGFTLEEG
jgi:flavin-binding protein dodecin